MEKVERSIKHKSIKLNMFLNYIRTMLSLLFPLITFPYASRILMPEGLGKVNFARSIIQYFVLLAMLGIKAYGVRECAKCRDDREKLSKLCFELFTINIIATIGAYIILFWAMLMIPTLSNYRMLLVVLSCTLLFNTIGMEWLYSGLEEYGYITLRSVFFQIISLVLLFAMVHTKEDYLKYAAISVISSAGSNICNLIHVRKFISFDISKKLELKKHIKPVFVFFAIALIIELYTVLDVTMLGFIKGNEQVGFYTVATKINKIILSLISAVCVALFPRLSYYMGNQKHDKFYELFYKSFSFVLFLTIPAAVGLNLLSEPIVYLFAGKNYDASVLPMKIMNPIIVIIGLGILLGSQFFVAIGKEKVTIIADSVGALINFSLNIFLIPQYGVLGAAIATLIAELFVTFTDLMFGMKYFSLSKAFAPVWQYLAASVIMGVVVRFVSGLFQGDFVKVISGVGSGIVIYFLILLLMKNEMACKMISMLKLK